MQAGLWSQATLKLIHVYKRVQFRQSSYKLNKISSGKVKYVIKVGNMEKSEK